jgi:hypothetical protein
MALIWRRRHRFQRDCGEDRFGTIRTIINDEALRGDLKQARLVVNEVDPIGWTGIGVT